MTYTYVINNFVHCLKKATRSYLDCDDAVSNVGGCEGINIKDRSYSLAYDFWWANKSAPDDVQAIYVTV